MIPGGFSGSMGGRTSLHLCQESSSLSSLDSKERSLGEEAAPALGMALGDSDHRWLIQVERKVPLRVTPSIEFLPRIPLGPISQSVVLRPPIADVGVEAGAVKKASAQVGQDAGKPMADAGWCLGETNTIL